MNVYSSCFFCHIQQPLINSLIWTKYFIKNAKGFVLECATNHLSLFVRKPAFCICENKDADQLRGNREADQRLCFRYVDGTIPLLPIYEISSL